MPQSAKARRAHDFIEEDPLSGRPRGFAKALRDVLAALVAADVRGVIIGAGALAAHGAPRYTDDIDVLLDDVSARKLVRTLFDNGWKGPPPSRDVFFYTMESQTGVEVDVMGAVEDLYLDVIEAAVAGTFMGEQVLVPTPENYVLLKLRAAEDSPEDRLKHMADALKLVQVRSETDLSKVRRYIGSRETDLRDVMAELDQHIVRSRQPSKRRR